MVDEKGVHLDHCNQGEYEGSCKYGEKDCPALPYNYELGFDEDHTVGASRRGSIKKSHRAEGRNWVD